MFLKTLDAYGYARDAFPTDYPAAFNAPVEKQIPSAKKLSFNFRTAIISDMHLGRRVAFVEYLLEFLYNVEFDKLIINGDGFDGLNWAGNACEDLPELHKRCIDAMFAFVARGGELVYIPGNHDEEATPDKTIDKTIRFKNRDGRNLEIKVCERHEHIDLNGDINLVLHGHQKDNWHQNRLMKKIAEFADYVYEPALKLSQAFRKAVINYLGWDISLIAPLKFGVKKLVGVDKNLRRAMQDELADGYYKRVFCGHTHHAELHENTGNSGNFVEDGNFLAETWDGEWKLYKMPDVRKELGLKRLPNEFGSNPYAVFRGFSDCAIGMLCGLYPKQGKARPKTISSISIIKARSSERVIFLPAQERALAA